MKKYDVIVIGGGISGCMAAIAAARAGVSVILIEKYGFLGGTLTACGTGPMMTFHAGDKLVIRGICDELIQRLQKKGLSTGHILDTTNYTYTVTPFDAEGMKRELEEMCAEAGVSLLYHCYVTDVTSKEDRVISVEITHKNGKEIVEGIFFVDATGDCDITYIIGKAYTQGRMKDGKTQPLTMNFKVCNVNVEKIKEYIKANPTQFPGLEGKVDIVDKAERLSMGGYVNFLKEAIRDKKISFVREGILFFETNTKGEIIVNTSRILNVDPMNPFELTKAEIIGRKQAMEVFNLLKSEVYGFEDAILEGTGPFIGVRSSRQIVGKYTLTAQDILNCREFPDTIACGGYPIDIHSPDGLDENNKEYIKFKSGEIYNIPLACMYGDIKNLITVGRCISATYEAQGAIRVSPIAGAIGQAGGVAAAVCVLNHVDIQDVNINCVKEILRQQNAY